MPIHLVGRTSCCSPVSGIAGAAAKLAALTSALSLFSQVALAQAPGGMTPPASTVDTVARRITGVLITAGPDVTAGIGRVADIGMGFTTDVGMIPQSVYVISRQLLFEQQPATLSEVVRNIPGVSAARVTAETFRGFKLRGFPVTETVTDGIRNTGSLNIQPDGLANLERVEVMTGPSGAIFGQAGGGGGAVNLVTKKPLGAARYEATIGAGESGLMQGTFDAGGPLTSGKTLRYRLVGGYDRRHSVVDFVEPKAFQVAPSVEWTRGVTSLLYQLDWREREQVRFHSLPFVGTLIGTQHVRVERDLFTGEPAQGHTKNHGLQQTLQLRRILGEKTLARVYARLTANTYFQPSVTPRTIQADSVHLNRRFTLFDDTEDEIVAGAQVSRRQDLEAEFSPVAGMTIVPGRYDFAQHGVTYKPDLSGPLWAWVTVASGGYFDGRRDKAIVRLRAAPSPRLSLTFDYEGNRLLDVGAMSADARTHLFYPEIRAALNPRLQLVGLWQYNSVSGQTSWNGRLSWEFAPLSFIYLVYNDRYLRDDLTATLPAERRLILKVSYLAQLSR